MDPEIASICRRAAQRFEDMGATVEENHPDFSGLQHVFQTFRALGMAVRHGNQLDQLRSVLKPEIVWNVEKGLSLTAEEIARAMTTRAAIYARARLSSRTTIYSFHRPRLFHPIQLNSASSNPG
ncbi:MAG: hypothetical protein Ct9H300mP14_04400 [Gammaproteobacteria bacterium]|nr:MAG: hypothetical protein Ct9H300mP14_04400 [Gammaproteobacteria bacterium]